VKQGVMDVAFIRLSDRHSTQFAPDHSPAGIERGTPKTQTGNDEGDGGRGLNAPTILIVASMNPRM